MEVDLAVTPDGVVHTVYGVWTDAEERTLLHAWGGLAGFQMDVLFQPTSTMQSPSAPLLAVSAAGQLQCASTEPAAMVEGHRPGGHVLQSRLQHGQQRGSWRNARQAGQGLGEVARHIVAQQALQGLQGRVGAPGIGEDAQGVGGQVGAEQERQGIVAKVCAEVEHQHGHAVDDRVLATAAWVGAVENALYQVILGDPVAATDLQLVDVARRPAAHADRSELFEVGPPHLSRR